MTNTLRKINSTAQISKSVYNNEINIGVHRLTFDKENQYVKIECNDPDYIFLCKIIPAKITYNGLESLINKQEPRNGDITYLYN